MNDSIKLKFLECKYLGDRWKIEIFGIWKFIFSSTIVVNRQTQGFLILLGKFRWLFIGNSNYYFQTGKTTSSMNNL